MEIIKLDQAPKMKLDMEGTKEFLVGENNQEHPVKKGDFAFLPPNEKHQFKNKSETEELVFICAVPNECE